MTYAYVLLSDQDGRFYIGSTGDLRARLQKHNSGAVRSTAYRRPLRLIYYEGCLSTDDARRRERYLKSGRGGAISNNASLPGWLKVVATSWNGTSCGKTRSFR
jgi:putative endonuclease